MKNRLTPRPSHAAMPAAALLLVCLLAGNVHGEEGWIEREEGELLFRFKESDRRLVAHFIDETAEARARILSDLSLDAPGPITIAVAATHEEFLSLQPSGSRVPRWAAGVAHPAHGLVVIKSPKILLGGQPDFAKVFLHEYSHVVLARAMGATPVPKWLHEGFAAYEAREWSLSRQTVLLKAILAGKLFSLRALTSSWPAGESEARIAYAQSWDLVGFILNTYGSEAFPEFLRQLRMKGSLDRALRVAYGISAWGLEKAWLKQIKRRNAWIPLATSSGAIWFAASLIFLAGYMRKRHRAKLKMRLWEIEEALDAEDRKPGAGPFLH